MLKSAYGAEGFRSVPVALVTGSSRGLGRGVALELASHGFSVAIHYSGNEAAARESLALCSAAAPSSDQRFGIFRCDIADPAQRSALVDEVFSFFGSVDALVNNAGIGPKVRADILDASEESFEEVLRTNLQGPYFLTQAMARRWLAGNAPSALPQGHTVIFVTSISAATASIGRGEYCVSKAGLSMAAQLWAARLAGSGIQVYELRPGIMETDMTKGVKAKYDALIAEGVVPQKRWGYPADVGRAVRSLLEGDFAYSTGNIFNIDGGFQISRL
ncbi:MAG: 3-ketoacyl-ACP reductase [Spirochaetae bacterium HGW-Spirochaetae-9]|nr:MAG: 3-ketoacyl-ACP reductase [Spirochaetae bacterium HGW-Spirochaetae-9]